MEPHGRVTTATTRTREDTDECRNLQRPGRRLRRGERGRVGGAGSGWPATVRTGTCAWRGRRSCTAGALACSDATGDTPDICDGLDDDCDAASADGSEDPGWASRATVRTGICALKERRSAPRRAGLQRRDGRHAGHLQRPGRRLRCGERGRVGGSGDGRGVRRCGRRSVRGGDEGLHGGRGECGDATGDTPDICNGLDDDCDAASADGSEDPGIGVACDGPDGDLCVGGATVCTAGAVECGDATGDTPDICNGAGRRLRRGERGRVGGSGRGRGVRRSGRRPVLGGSASAHRRGECERRDGRHLDICNGVDDDCDAASADGSEDPGWAWRATVPTATCAWRERRSAPRARWSAATRRATPRTSATAWTTTAMRRARTGRRIRGSAWRATAPTATCAWKERRSAPAGALECSDATGDTPDICNGLDDDCDAASADGSEDPGVGAVCDGPDGDLCAEGSDGLHHRRAGVQRRDERHAGHL